MTINILLAVLMIWAGISVVLFVSTLIFFLAVIKFRDAQDSGLLKDVHFSVLWVGYSTLAVGLILDTLLNWIFLTVTYLELPREFLATARLVRHKNKSNGWRKSQSLWWCKNWLTPFDILHCGKDFIAQLKPEDSRTS